MPSFSALFSKRRKPARVTSSSSASASSVTACSETKARVSSRSSSSLSGCYSTQSRFSVSGPAEAQQLNQGRDRTCVRAAISSAIEDQVLWKTGGEIDLDAPKMVTGLNALVGHCRGCEPTEFHKKRVACPIKENGDYSKTYMVDLEIYESTDRYKAYALEHESLCGADTRNTKECLETAIIQYRVEEVHAHSDNIGLHCVYLCGLDKGAWSWIGQNSHGALSNPNPRISIRNHQYKIYTVVVKNIWDQGRTEEDDKLIAKYACPPSQNTVSSSFSIRPQSRKAESVADLKDEDRPTIHKRRTMITLTSSDQRSFEIQTRYVLLSKLVSNILDGDPNAPSIRIVQVDGATLELIVKYLRHHKGMVPVEIAKPIRSMKMEEIVEDTWDAVYINALTKRTLFRLILGANYMDITPLLHLGCAKVATKIKGKSSEEIKWILGEDSPDHFT